jgi:hypothetical protein
MAYVSTNYDHNPNAHRGQWVGAAPNYGQCVSYVEAVVPEVPRPTSRWGKGPLVKGTAGILPGTVIATFNASGHYEGHAAIYVSQELRGPISGINVWDQWIIPPPKAIGPRMLRFGARGHSNNGDNFYVVL